MLRAFLLVVPLLASACASSPKPEAAEPAIDWRSQEKGLAQPTQLTFPDRFAKAGEAYFDPSATRVVFQAIEKGPDGQPASPWYGMYVAELRRNAAGGAPWSLANIRRVSPPGTSNT
jgi:hypothetical protein